MERNGLVWTVRSPWSGRLYGFKRSRARAERKKRQLARHEIPTVVRREPREGLYDELTALQELPPLSSQAELMASPVSSRW